MDTFQKETAQNKGFILALIRAFHPDFNDRNVYVISVKYDWICIKSSHISLGINFETPFHGDGYSLNDFKECRKKDYFKAWRFADDSKYDTFDPDKNHLALIFKQYKIRKPTASEMFNYYYKD